MNVLIVEDNPEVRELLRELFKTRDICGVKTVATLREGIRCMAAERFDWVVLDYQLPDGIGTDFARVVRSGDYRMVLFSSDAVSAEIRAEAESLGIEKCFAKPDDTCRLVMYIAESPERGEE